MCLKIYGLLSFKMTSSLAYCCGLRGIKREKNNVRTFFSGNSNCCLYFSFICMCKKKRFISSQRESFIFCPNEALFNMFSVLPLQVTPRTAALSSIKCAQTRHSVGTQAPLLCCVLCFMDYNINLLVYVNL